MYLLLTIMKNSYLNLAFVFSSVAVDGDVQLSKRKAFRLSLSGNLYCVSYCFYKTLSLTFTVYNNGNNGKNIVIFMSYDSMNDILAMLKINLNMTKKYAIIQIFVKI
jgi:hypothetical protein